MTRKKHEKYEETDRGPYRSCYIAMADDADIHAMSGDAFKLFWMLKLTLPTAGIGVVYDSVLVDRVGVTRERLQELFTELEMPKPGSDRGWIMRDRNIVWVVRALDCEPGMAFYSPNHRKSVHGSVNQLLQRSPVVVAFREFYSKWFVDPSGADSGSDSKDSGEESAKGSGKASERGSGKGSERDSDPVAVAVAVQNQFITGEVVDLEHPPAGGAVDAAAVGSSSATDSPAAQGASNNPGKSPPPADDAGLGSLWQLLGECYDLTEKPTAASKPRQKQVYRDLRATLTEKGALLERDVYVRAVDAAHLNAVCRNVLARVKDKDAAVRLVLLELRDTWQGVKAAREKATLGEEAAPPRTANQRPTAPTPIASIIPESEAARDSVVPIASRVQFPAVILPKPKAKGLDEAERWLDAMNPDDRARLSIELDRQINLVCPEKVNAPSTRAQMRADLLVKTWTHRDADGRPRLLHFHDDEQGDVA